MLKPKLPNPVRRMQLLMRRPEISGFLSIAPPANLYDFTFLAPCPSSGLFVSGTEDKVVPHEDARALADRLTAQKDIVIDHALIEGTNHFFEGKLDELNTVLNDYLDIHMKRVDEEAGR